MVRDTLWPDQIGPLSHGHVRRAVLTAWLTFLRQTTGSCFATAPAMLIQRSDPVRMIQDLDAMLSSGELRRGSYAAPLYKGLGPGDLQRPIGFYPAALSPGLEAAFQAAQAPFPQIDASCVSPKQFIEEGLLVHFGLTRKDLVKETVSLAPQAGLLWERLGGHYGGFSSKTKEIHSWEKEVKKAERAFLSLADCALLRSWEYTLASFCDVKMEFSHWNLFVSLGMHPEKKPPGIGAFLLQSVQAKLDAANQRIEQIRFEYQRAAQAVHAAERLLGQASSAAERSRFQAELYAQVDAANHFAARMEEERQIAVWLSEFFSHFLRDAIEKLQGAFQEVFDPSLSVAEAERFEDSPAGFRLLYKSGRSAAASWERIEDESQFVNAVYKFFESLENQYVVDPVLKSGFTEIMTELLQYIRSEEFIVFALERAKEHKKPKQAKPWAYQSGGTMQTLLQSYYELEEKPQEFARKIRTPQQLHRFLCEAAKQAKSKELLMFSPTHAFLFCPSLMGAEDALEKGFRFTREISVSSSQIEFLMDRLSEYLPSDARPLFYSGCRRVLAPENLSGLRSLLVSGWMAAQQTDIGRIDSFLYGALPVLSSDRARQAVERMSFQLKIPAPSLPKRPAMLPIDLLQIMKGALIEAKGPFSSVDWDDLLADAARKEGIIYPSPVLFADTNWSDWLFGIIANGATGQAELWRLNRTGTVGAPMSEWNHLFLEEGRWGVFTAGFG